MTCFVLGISFSADCDGDDQGARHKESRVDWDGFVKITEWHYKCWQRFPSVHKAHRTPITLGLSQSSASYARTVGKIIQTLCERSSTNWWFCRSGGRFDLLFFFIRHTDHNNWLNWC